ncbi:plasmid mobilization protein [Fodinicurvata fenggangensis]|uniref:plasmid mobilization protein n=1 Tax=Fodinicurvata fenggangensis TaxID=1121830 RepID=UPI0012DCE29D|nr:mobilization protein [Fodinicurvata fenggangensis]
MPRKKRIGIRLTDDEHAHIFARAGAMHVSEFIRAQALGRRPRLPRQIPAINQAAWSDLARCLGNLNQITRAVNRGEVPADSETGKTLLRRIDEINAHVRDLRNHLIGADQESAR